MPTYDYRCEACEHTFDAFQSFSEKPLRKCPECGKLKLRRLIGTGAAVIFKGAGFYQTDYRSESYKSAAKSDQEAAKSASSAPSSTSDTNGTGKGGKEKSAEGKSSSPSK